MLIFVIESVVLCLMFTLMVFIMSRKPIKTLYNYPPKIQERVKSLEEYKDQIPTNKNKVAAKLIACILFSRARKTWWMNITIIGFILRDSLSEKVWLLLSVPWQEL